jgi:hypothetical protein
MPELSLTSCGDVLDPTKTSTYEFLTTFLTELVGSFDDALLMLGGDEVGFDPKCTSLSSLFSLLFSLFSRSLSLARSLVGGFVW